MQCNAWLAVNRRIFVSLDVVHDDAGACGIKDTFALIRENRNFQCKLNDKLGTILLDILRRFGVKTFALRFVDLLSSEKNSAMFFNRENFSAELIFQLRKFDYA